MSALVKVEQTELGGLVSKREELQKTATNLRRALRDIRGTFDEVAEKKKRKEYLDNIERNIQMSREKRREYEDAQAERQRLMDLTENGKVQDLLRDGGGSGGFKYWIDRYKADTRSYEAQLAAEAKRHEENPVADPRIKYSNSLATVELQLAEVRRSIKRIMEG